MQYPRDYVEHLRAKSIPERNRIALVVAAAITGVIALGYIAALGSSDRLVIKDEPVATDLAAAASGSRQSASSLLGAAAAFRSNDGDITVVQSSSSSTINDESEDEATVIPF